MMYNQIGALPEFDGQINPLPGYVGTNRRTISREMPFSLDELPQQPTSVGPK